MSFLISSSMALAVSSEYSRLPPKSMKLTRSVVFAVEDEAEAVVHAPVADHFAGEAGGLADIAAGAGVDVAGEHFLGDAAAEADFHERRCTTSCEWVMRSFSGRAIVAPP